MGELNDMGFVIKKIGAPGGIEKPFVCLIHMLKNVYDIIPVDEKGELKKKINWLFI